MNKELKTLKNLLRVDWTEDGELWIQERHLKAEAVKWVKYYQADGFEAMLLRKFFNLTDDYLEGGGNDEK